MGAKMNKCIGILGKVFGHEFESYVRFQSTHMIKYYRDVPANDYSVLAMSFGLVAKNPELWNYFSYKLCKRCGEQKEVSND